MNPKLTFVEKRVPYKDSIFSKLYLRLSDQSTVKRNFTERPVYINASHLFNPDTEMKNRVMMCMLDYYKENQHRLTSMTLFENYWLAKGLTDEERENLIKKHPAMESHINYAIMKCYDDAKHEADMRQFCHDERTGLKKLDVAQMTDDELKQLKKMVNAECKKRKEMGIQDKRRPIRLNPNNPRIICELYCLGFEECPSFKDIEQIKKCGCYAVLKDRHGKEVLKALKGETDESHSSN